MVNGQCLLVTGLNGDRLTCNPGSIPALHKARRRCWVVLAMPRSMTLLPSMAEGRGTLRRAAVGPHMGEGPEMLPTMLRVQATAMAGLALWHGRPSPSQAGRTGGGAWAGSHA